MKTPSVIGEVDLHIVLNNIISNPNHVRIMAARSYGKGHPLYEKIKAEEPTFTPNACFNDRRTLSDLKNLTSLIFLDFDKQVDPTFFTTIPFVYASWLSFGGQGHSVLIAVKGLTRDRFLMVWNYLNHYFGQRNFIIDPQTKDITRQVVISSDPDLFMNHYCIPLDVSTKFPYCTTSTLSGNNIFSQPTLSGCSQPGYTSNLTTLLTGKLKYRTTLDDYQGKDFIIIENGHPYRNAFLPKEIREGRRNRLLREYTLSLMYNNRFVSKSRLETELLKVNNNRCIPALSVQEVMSIVKWCYDKFSSDPSIIPTKMKRIWINPEANLTTKQKRMIVGKQTGILKRNKTVSELTEIYIRLEKEVKQVTQKLLERNSRVKIRTIKKYWHEIKEGACCN